MSDGVSDDRNAGSKPPSAATPWRFNAESARTAARKSAEVRTKKARAKRSPEQLAELAQGDLLYVREQALDALKRGKLGARERVDLLRLVASTAETVLDRTQGRPRPGREPERWSPDEYAQAVARIEAEGRAYAAQEAAEEDQAAGGRETDEAG